MNTRALSLYFSTAAALMILLPDQAQGRTDFPDTVPNGSVASCATCHLSPAGGGTRNDFGLDYSTSSRDWLQIYDTDSDDDGQTNGQELGDPCGVWREGDTPARTAEISNPGDPGGTTVVPNEPSCTTTTDGGVPAADNNSGGAGCDCSSAVNTRARKGGLAFVALLLCGAALRRRARLHRR